MRAVDAVYRHPGGAHPINRNIFGTFTLLAWSGYLYLWLPLITLLAWTLGLHTAWTEWVRQHQSVDVGALALAAGVSFALCMTLVLWAEHDRRRFTGKERRSRAQDVASTEVARNLGASTEVLTALQGAAVVRVHCRSDGSPESVEVLRTQWTMLDIPSQRRPDQPQEQLSVLVSTVDSCAPSWISSAASHPSRSSPTSPPPATSPGRSPT